MNQILSDEEEAELGNKLYEDIKSGRLTNAVTIAIDRGWNMALAVFRVKKLIEAGRVRHDVVYLYPRTEPHSQEIDDLNNGFAGKTLSYVSSRIAENGDQYTRFHFGPTFYEFLSHFTANDHQVAVATETLQRIRDNSGIDGVAAAVAAEALEKMEAFKNGR